MCHNAVRGALCGGAKDTGAPYATPEPGGIVRAIGDHSFVLELDAGIQLPSSKRIAIDTSVHHYRANLQSRESNKKNGHGTLAQRRQAQEALHAAQRALDCLESGSAEAAAQRDTISAARNRLSNAYHPGYAAACTAAGYEFYPVALDEFGNFGEGALALLTELQHPSDNQIRGRDLSPHGNDKGHWFHQDMTFVTGKSREWIAQRVAVAIVNATYDAARAVAERCPRPDADAFPPIPPVFLGAYRVIRHSPEHTTEDLK